MPRTGHISHQKRLKAFYWTTSVIVIVWVSAIAPDPDVADTVIMLAPAGVPGLVGPDDECPPPPHPAVSTFVAVIARFGATVVGEKPHEASEGSLEQLKLTAALNSFAGIRST